MLELRCPACGRANALVDVDTLARTRCAECEGYLDEHCQVRYLVSDDRHGNEPRLYRDLVRGVAAETLAPDVLLSEEGGPWFRAGERSDLFPRARPAVLRAPRQKSRLRQTTRGPPGSVAAMIALELAAGVLILVAAVLAFGLLASLGAVGEGLPVVVILGLVGVGHFRLAGALRRRSKMARNVQLGLAGLGGLALLLLLGNGAPGWVVLSAGAFVAIPFLLLAGNEAQAWFGGTEDQA